MRKHTHRGHCQACGGLQAAVIARRQMLAKHGYTVPYGYFVGECSGSNRLPIEYDRTHADSIIKSFELTARNAESVITSIDAGRYEWPTQIKTGVQRDPQRRYLRKQPVYLDVYTPTNEATEEQRNAHLRECRIAQERLASFMRDHAAHLRGLITQYHGKPLVPADPPKPEIKVGSVIRIYGKEYTVKGFTYRARGFQQNVRHVVTTDGAMFAQRNCRLIK